MTMRYSIGTLILWMALCTGAWAAPAGFKVEMVFFTYPNAHLHSQYYDTRESIEPRLRDAMKLGLKPVDGFRLLPATDYDLGGVVRRLRASGRYHPLYHFAWRQPALGRRHAKAIRIQAGKDYTARFGKTARNDTGNVGQPGRLYQLAGTVKLIFSHNFYIKLDLRYREPYRPQVPDSAGFNTFNPLKLASYPIKAGRELHTGRLYYIDHPKLGTIVEIAPIKAQKKHAQSKK